jgi:hypothetical protein
MLRDNIDRGVYVCPWTAIDGWSGAGGAACGFGVCACAAAAITHMYRLNLDFSIATSKILI